MKNPSNQTADNYIVSAIKLIAYLHFIVGIICVVLSINNENLRVILFIAGLTCILCCPIIWGFAYIVEAACRYLGKSENKEIEKSSESLATKATSTKKLTDDERIANLRVLVGTGALSQEEFDKEVNRINSK